MKFLKYTILALGAFALASCADDTPQPVFTVPQIQMTVTDLTPWTCTATFSTPRTTMWCEPRIMWNDYGHYFYENGRNYSVQTFLSPDQLTNTGTIHELEPGKEYSVEVSCRTGEDRYATQYFTIMPTPGTFTTPTIDEWCTPENLGKFFDLNVDYYWWDAWNPYTVGMEFRFNGYGGYGAGLYGDATIILCTDATLNNVIAEATQIGQLQNGDIYFGIDLTSWANTPLYVGIKTNYIYNDAELGEQTGLCMEPIILKK